jgi:antitoxin MazE
MYATIQRWGNSHGIRLPKVLLDELGIRENDRVEILHSKDAITIKKTVRRPHRTLEERLVEFYGKPLEEISAVEAEREVDWGCPEGGEAW